MITYHSRRLVYDKHGNVLVDKSGTAVKKAPTHTLTFEKLNDDYLLMTFAIPSEKFDNFEKKRGKFISEGRMVALKNNIDVKEEKYNHYLINTKALKEIFKSYRCLALTRDIPQKIKKTFEHYVNRAIRYYKMTNFEKINLYVIKQS